MTLPDDDLLQVQAETLFVHDPAGRIVAENEPVPRPCARFFFARTRTGNLWRVRHDVPGEIARQLDTLAASEPVNDTLEAPPVRLEAMREALRVDDTPPEMEFGPAFRFPGEIPEPDGITRVTRANLEILRPMVPDFGDLEREFERGEPSLVKLVDGTPVATAFSSHLGERAAEVGVWTMEEHQGRGYATALVAAWARAARESGLIPLYSTEWENLASRGVARKLGLVMYASDLMVF